MRFPTTLSLASIIAIVTLTTPACSSDDSGGSSTKPVTYPPDAATTIPPETPARKPITVLVKGHGHVQSLDGSFNCEETTGSADAGAGCHPAHYGTTIYAAAYLPWAFDHWEPSLSVNSSVELESWTDDTITAVFVPIPGTDAGH